MMSIGDIYILTDKGRGVLSGRVKLFLGTAAPIDKTILRYLSNFDEGRTYDQIVSATQGQDSLLWGRKELEITPEYRLRSLSRLLRWGYIEIT